MQTSPLNGQRDTSGQRDTARLSPLRERARVALEAEKVRAQREARARHDTLTREKRDALRRLTREVLGEIIEPDAIRFPKDPSARLWLDVSTEIDGLPFRVVARGGGDDNDPAEVHFVLEVQLRCPACHDASWWRVTSLADLGSWLDQMADDSLAESCRDCLMAAEFADDPFAGE